MAAADALTSAGFLFTHVKEGAGILQNQLTGIRFVLAVIHINVELIRLENRREEDASNIPAHPGLSQAGGF